MISAARQQLEQYFEFSSAKADWRTEVLAGVTTFVTMAYILFVNPSILATTGMPAAGAAAATCVAAAFGSLLMGAWARYPIALAPGMGLNAYFAYTVVASLGIPWQTALGAVFLSGVLFLLMTAAGIRQWLLHAIPRELYSSVAAGIGLFIAFIGLRNAGVVQPDASTLVKLGNLRDPKTLLALAAFVLTAALYARGVKAAILIGVAAAAAAGLISGITPWPPASVEPEQWTSTFGRLDILATIRLGLFEIVFVFLFVDLFDNLGTLVAVGKRARLIGADGAIPRLNRILTADALATAAGAWCGTSTVVSYVESAAGVAAGGRTGVTAVVTGLLFLLALPLAPLAPAIPTQATACALILVGALMVEHTVEIDWDDKAVAIPSFLTMTTIPLTFSIANGLALGFTSYVLLQAATGRARRIHPLLYVLVAVFLFRFAWLAAG